jgi:hypothetical protein
MVMQGLIYLSYKPTLSYFQCFSLGFAFCFLFLSLNDIGGAAGCSSLTSLVATNGMIYVSDTGSNKILSLSLSNQYQVYTIAGKIPCFFLFRSFL